MMDKKSANGVQAKTNEGGVQRKQLPYSVETPYGFHLDLDFLKYVDDIEKGNTIKRVHIQRRVKGPPKFSTLPRNFSLPGNGARPAPKEKESAWSGTSTLGPKPKSRVTEVQQIFDFRANEGGTSCRGTTGQGTDYMSAKSRDEGAQGVDEKSVGIQSRPNLLRASSMPITLQQRKGSDSSSPDRTLGTPENGSTENMFRPSPDITERRCVPQDRAGLHQQITVALKRVRELEEQVKTIPQLKAQICSLRLEREKLLLELQAQAQAQAQVQPQVPVSTSDIVDLRSDAGTRTQSQGHRPKGGFNLDLITQPVSSLEALEHVPEKQVTEKEELSVSEKSRLLQREELKQEPVKSSEKESRQKQPLEKAAIQKETIGGASEHAGQKLPVDIQGQAVTSCVVAVKDPGLTAIQDANAAKGGKLQDSGSVQNLHEKLMMLEAKLTQASQELERTNSLLKEQMADNKLKEERIIQLSEGMRVEVCAAEVHTRPRRQSIDTGTETERVDVVNRETETESPGTVDQGTDTERICVEVCVPKPSGGGVDQRTEIGKVDTHDQVTETEAEGAAASPLRPRANSIEQGTVTERVSTQDQTTETPVAERVNRVTETDGESTTDHPLRPRASSVDRGTETERVDTVDRVTETEAAQRTDRHTETEVERQHNNPAAHAEAESQVRESAGIRGVDVEPVVRDTETIMTASERIQRDDGVGEYVVMKVVTQSSVLVTDSAASDIVSQVEELRSQFAAAAGEHPQPESEVAQIDSDAKEIEPPKSDLTENVEMQQVSPLMDSAIVCVTIKETAVVDRVVASAAAEDAALKAVVPVRPQRGRRPSAEQAQPPSSQLQAAPVRPRRGSSETQAQQSQPEKKPQPEVQQQPELEAQPPAQLSERQLKHECPSPSQVEDNTIAKRPPGSSSDKLLQSQPQEGSRDLSPSSKDVQIRPKSIQSQSQYQTSATRRDSKELKAPQKGSIVSQPSSRGSGEAQTHPIRQGSCEVQSQSPRISTEVPHKDAGETQSQRRGSTEAAQRRGSGEAQAARRDSGEAPTIRRGSTEAAQRRGSGEAQAARRDSGEAPTIRRGSTEAAQRRGSGEAQAARRDSGEAPTIRRGSTEAAQRRGSGEAQATCRDSGEAPTIRRGSTEAAQRRGSGEAQAARRESGEAPPQRRVSTEAAQRRGSGEAQTSRRDSGEAPTIRRGSTEAAHHRGSGETQTARQDSGEAPPLRRGSSESPTSPAALGQVVTRLTGLLGEQWAQLGSSSGAQQSASQQESPSTQKQTAGKRAEAGKGASAKPAGKAAAAAAATGKPAGKPGPSKMSTIQSQLVSSLSVLSAFYSPAQKAAAASKQQEQGLKSIMKKNGVADKQGNKGAKKNLKFVGVNGGYETTSSEESSGDEKPKVEAEGEEEEDSSEPEVEKAKEPEPAERLEGAAEAHEKEAEASPEAGGAVAAETGSERGLLDPDSSREILEGHAEGERVDKGFIDACLYVKDRMEEVSSPDKEMRQVLVVLYQEWFKVSSQKDSQADTVRSYLRQVGLTTPTLLPYVVNLTDGNGNMALHYSVSHSNFPVVKLLLDTGLCETDNVNKAGYTPVMLAALTAAESPDDLEVAQQLLRLGDVNARSRQTGQTALMLAVSHGRLAMVRLLLGCGADVNAQDREGSTALMCASEHGHTQIARLLLETGRCDAGLKDKNDQTARAVAEAASHQDIIDLLMAHADAPTPGTELH